MERGDIQDNAIIEIGFEMQFRRPPQLVFKVAQFGEEVFLLFSFLGESFRFLAGVARCGLMAAERFETAGFQTNLRFDVIYQRLEQQVFVEAMVIQPEGVVLLRGLK